MNLNCYADDTQLCLSMKPDENNQLVRLQVCLKNIKAWMTLNGVVQNTDKREVTVFDTSEAYFLTTWLL